MPTAAEMEAKVAKLDVNLDRFNGIVNGPDSGVGSEITVDSGTVKSVARIQKDFQDAADEILGDLGDVAGAVSTAEAAASTATTKAGEAAASAASAAADAAMLDMVAGDLSHGYLGNTVDMETGTTGIAITDATKVGMTPYLHDGVITRIRNRNDQVTSGPMHIKQVSRTAGMLKVERSDTITVPASSSDWIVLSDPIPVLKGQYPGFHSFSTVGRTKTISSARLIWPHWTVSGNKVAADAAWAEGSAVTNIGLCWGVEVLYDNGQIEEIVLGAPEQKRIVWGVAGPTVMTGTASPTAAGYKTIVEPFRETVLLEEMRVAVEVAGPITFAAWEHIDDGTGFRMKAIWKEYFASTGAEQLVTSLPTDLVCEANKVFISVYETNNSGRLSCNTVSTKVTTYGTSLLIPLTGDVGTAVQATTTSTERQWQVRITGRVLRQRKPDGVFYKTRFAAGTLPATEYNNQSTLNTVSAGKFTIGEEGANKGLVGRRAQAANKVMLRARIRTPNKRNNIGLLPHANGYGSQACIDVENDRIIVYKSTSGGTSPSGTLPTVFKIIDHPFPTPMTIDDIILAEGRRFNRFKSWRFMREGTGEIAGCDPALASYDAVAAQYDCSVVVDMRVWNPNGTETSNYQDHFNDIGQFCGKPFFYTPTGGGLGGELLELDVILGDAAAHKAVASDSMMQSRVDEDEGFGYMFCEHAEGGGVMWGRDGMVISTFMREYRDSYWVYPNMETVWLNQGMNETGGGSTIADLMDFFEVTVEAMINNGHRVVLATPAPTFPSSADYDTQQDLVADMRAYALSLDQNKVRYCPINERFIDAAGDRLDEYFYRYPDPAVLVEAHYGVPGHRRHLQTGAAFNGDWLGLPTAKLW